MSEHLSLDVFLDILLEMPDIEALQELDLRKDHLALQQQMLSQERQRCDSKSERFKVAGREMLVIGKDLTRLGIRRKEINNRMNRLQWAKAVTALYGQEGYAACREWMALNSASEVPA